MNRIVVAISNYVLSIIVDDKYTLHRFKAYLNRTTPKQGHTKFLVFTDQDKIELHKFIFMKNHHDYALMKFRIEELKKKLTENKPEED